MSEYSPETPPIQPSPPVRRSNAVAVTAIIAFTIVMLACITACTISVYAFLNNAPW